MGGIEAQRRGFPDERAIWRSLKKGHPQGLKPLYS
jgi:hypothetical protein